MFTGIVEAVSEVTAMSGTSLAVSRPESFGDIKEGDSIAVAGVCLTVREYDDASITFDVVPETRRKTTLGNMLSGEKVNLERALRADGRFAGHVVQGHCEATADIVAVTRHGDDVLLTLSIPPELHPFIVPRGSVTLDGVSLTIASFESGLLTVALIPHTLEHTTMGFRQEGESVNIETDIVGRYILASR